jgi:putative redox protein
MEVRVEHLGAMQFEIQARGHKVFSDQPLEIGGYDEGMTPPEVFLGALGARAGFYAAEYVKKRRLPPDGLAVRVKADKVKGPARLENLQIVVEYPHAIEQVHRDGLQKAVEVCLIHNTLLAKPHITTTIETEASRKSKRAA